MTQSVSQRLPFVRSEVDRDHAARFDQDLVDRLWNDPSARVLVVMDGQAPIQGAAALRLLPTSAVPRIEPVVYLGRTRAATPTEPVGTPVLGVSLSGDPHAGVAARLEVEWGALRSIAHLLSPRDLNLFTEAVAIFNWHGAHEFSPRSGQPTTVTMGGWVRVDPTNSEHFPRTDPAVIVAVTDRDDRLLLGSNAMWEHNRYSLLAGFVEPGESLEAAVEREVFEETGVLVTEPMYLGSQPWPFPASLMLGFTARVHDDWNGATVPDGEEILDLRWFSRDELTAALPQLLLPGPSSISRALIEHWYGAQIEDGSRP
ncbi:NAD(+) diphosphatase [Ruicaihuangia caeni]|uniref:NAD(+) diphosphatase n=1 Tax=Ruicaihuangia caeni TaxID=3042517 RepID=A0AAW6TCY7_9MICO|nr:NAD(+) diphosphatase [Klugiella sp. YN-L-19]MDI2099678.1 NAD(+) diphosphatase [Klugiella sp. YN-L-19]